ncbi:MAG: DNA repair protein RadA [Spirochaetes bacterium]|jgi:DNA repair protein RadA/Sms|nr:DNA repair protein RadA [Spirochaetota bacterium]
MPRQKTEYICASCGAVFSKWHGRCPECSQWNTVELHAPDAEKDKKSAGSMISLADVSPEGAERLMTGMSEFNIVCGGGIVPGSVILIGGEPGIGKSTLALQISEYFDAVYVSGEESPFQIKQRAERIGIKTGGIRIFTGTDVEDVISIIDRDRPRLIVIDSIQTISSKEISAPPGSVTQIRESAHRISVSAKKSGVPVMLIGHITKDGTIAGPKLLEHIVDTVLYFEGNFSKEYRILRAFKNRYGSVNEIGLFAMTEKGLAEVKDKNRIFLNPFVSSSPGNAISSAVEGTRTILFEVQSLVSYTSFPNPRRMADGFDLNRLILIAAVLEKHAALKLNTFDVFINVSGGFQINETSADLAVAMSIFSSLKNVPVPDGLGLLGEISLSGEIRPVSMCGRRVKEFIHSGFGKIIIPSGDVDEAAAAGFGGEIIGVKNINEAINKLV